MKQVEASELQATDYKVLPGSLLLEKCPNYQHQFSPDRGLIAAFCGLLWLLLLVGSIGAVAGVTVHLLQRSGGVINAR